MIDIEEQLSGALHRYADGVRPNAAPMSGVVRRARQHRQRRIGGVLAGAGVVTGLVAVVVTRGDDSQRIVDGTIPTTPVSLTPDTVGATTPSSEVASDAGGTWTALPPSPLSDREGSVVVWSGTEFIVWGGRSGLMAHRDGAAYNPATNTWRSIAMNTWAHPGGHAVWDGHEMVVAAKSGGAVYDPVADKWTDLPDIDIDAVGGVGISDLVWTGTAVVAIGYDVGGASGPTNTTVRMWQLADDHSAWIDLPFTTAFTLDPLQAYSIDGDIVIVAPDGRTERYSFADGWQPSTYVYGGPAGYIGGPNAIASDGTGLAATVSYSIDFGGGDARSIAVFRKGAWESTTDPIDGSRPVEGQALLAGDHLIVLGTSGIDVVYDVATAAESPTTPLNVAVAGQSVAWNGSELFVWGGRTTLEESSDVTSAGAVWRPSA